MKKRGLLLTGIMALFIGVGLNTAQAVTPETQPALVQLQQAVKLQGKVVNAKTGEAISGVEVKLAESEQSATTDENGLFVIDSLEAGTYTVTVEADGYESFEKKVELSADSKPLTIELSEKTDMD